MKTIRHILILTIFILTINSCRKDKLTGDNKALIGTWTSIPLTCGCCTALGTPQDPKFKLELIEKGIYKLYKDGKKVERGRLLNVDGIVTFVCSDLDKDSYLKGRKIVKFNNDTLNIDHSCEDEYVYTLIKK